MYAALAQITPSPSSSNVLSLVGMALGPAAGRAIVELLIGEPSLKHYHLLPGVRGDLLPKMGTPRRSARRVRASGADDAKQARA